MVAGHLREQNGIYQIILSWTGADGKRKTKSVSTKLPVKGNKRRAEEMLRKIRSEFNPENTIDNAAMSVSVFLQKWLKDRAHTMGASRYADYAYDVKVNISPYFDKQEITMEKLTVDALAGYFYYERTENKASVQTLLNRHEILMAALEYAVELGWLKENPAENVNPVEDDSKLLFTSFMLDWLNMMRSSVAESTYAEYTKAVKNKIVPYFDEHHPGLKLTSLTPKHIQDYYTYEMNVNGMTANTILHRQANIRKALQYAYKTGLIASNPACVIERPKVDKFVGSFYSLNELEQLFRVFKGDPLELIVIVTAFYGLRRSEVIGLRWDAIDFERKVITIRHTVHQFYQDGEEKVVAVDRTKTKSSYRSLPLVGPIEKILLDHKAQQEENKILCGNCYCYDYDDYIFVNPIGELLKPDYVSLHFAQMVKKHNLRKLRFHDLRHSCASLLFANGVSMKEIQEYLGHSTIGTTANIYTHMDENSKVKSANAIITMLDY